MFRNALSRNLFNVFDEADLPVDDLGISGAGEYGEGLAAARTVLFCTGEIMYHLLGRQTIAMFSTGSRDAGLVAPSASLGDERV